MPSAYEFRELISGARRGWRAAALRGALGLLETPYAAAMRVRNALYDWRLARAYRLPVPVVSVGNLTLGGTGKTPMVAWIARHLLESGRRVAIVSRGYGSAPGKPNDEALELARRLPGVPHVQNPDRVAASRQAIADHGCEIVVLDDAFQHRRIARDLDVVLLDAMEPFGFDRVFPRGTLREPLGGLARADVIVLSRADMVGRLERGDLRVRALGLAPNAIWVETRHRASVLVRGDGSQQPLERLAKRRAAAFCGIGNPAGFWHTVRACACRLVDCQEMPDHCAYSPAEVQWLDHWAKRVKADLVVCTLKDLVKLNRKQLGGKELWAIQVELEVTAGQEEMAICLRRLQ